MKKPIIIIFSIFLLTVPILAAERDINQQEYEIIEMLNLFEDTEFLNSMYLLEGIELISSVPILVAEEKVNQEEHEIIEMLDLLEDMDFLNDMELLEDIELMEVLEPLSVEGGGE